MHEERTSVNDVIASQIERIFTAVTQEKELTFEELALASAQLLQVQLREGVSIDDTEYQACLDKRLMKAGLNSRQRLEGQYILEKILVRAWHLKAEINGRRRGDDPACCDPGGGMRSLHEIEEDEQF
ncbi:hypothetical protein [Sinorhizobium meliloti]|nr:hypothetical protein U8C39_09685 [Sinorhizobium meliloti]WQP31727.1 hypothetical protein U8C45_09650 [Sinorhizobium meliloti]